MQRLPFVPGETGFHLEEDGLACWGVFQQDQVYGIRDTVLAITAAAAELLDVESDEELLYSDPVYQSGNRIVLRFQAAYKQKQPKEIQ